MPFFRMEASIRDFEIEKYLNNESEDEGGIPNRQLDDNMSDVEDHVEIEEEYPTDVDENNVSDDDEQPIRPPRQRRSGVILSSDSESEEQPNNRPAPSRIIIPSARNLRGKNGHKWSSVSSESTHTRAQARNIVHIVQGPANNAKNVSEPVDCFSLFISTEIINKIVEHTNHEITARSLKYKQQNATVSKTCAEEMKALLGLLLLTAVKKDNHLTSLELFDPTFSGSRYVAVMSRDRFDFLLNCLRFDDKSTREERKALDKFAPIREIWEIFISACRNNYKAGSYVAIDEQLLGFRGRCPFRMYIPSKPNKYGIKTVMICDAQTKYMIDAEPYIGKGSNTNDEPLGMYYVKTLTKTLWGSNRNVTMDNWFTSVPLTQELLKAPYKLTIVGTLRANKKEIPPELLNNKQRPIGSSMFCYDGNCTMVSYKPKNNKNVLLLSTTHGTGTLAPSGKPNIIEFYNSTKGAVDTFDQMCGNMSCSRKTQRWPLCYFFGILDMSVINSYVIYVHNLVNKSQKPKSRRSFVKEILEKLTEPWLRRRRETPTLKRCLKRNIDEVLGEIPTVEPPVATGSQKKICGFCDYKKRRMTRFQCTQCKKFMCMDHRGQLCVQCSE